MFEAKAIMINTVFFGLQLEAYFSELGLFGHCEYFRLHRALIKHWTENKNHRKLWCGKWKVKGLSLSQTKVKVSVPPFLFSSAPPRPWVPPYWGQGLLFLAVCLDQLQKSKSTSSLGWEDCNDGGLPLAVVDAWMGDHLAYMQKTCDVAEKAILAKKKLRKKCVNRDKSA